MSLEVFTQWLADAKSFYLRLADVEHLDFDTLALDVKEPISETKLSQLEKTLPYPLPDVFREIYTRCTAGATFRYVCDPDESVLQDIQNVFGQKYIYGGRTLFDSDALVAHIQEINDDADVAEEDGHGDQADYRRSVPFLRSGNGDFLAIHPDLNSVVYLGHEVGYMPLSKSFEQFLSHWPRYAYAGPEYWILKRFLGANGSLKSPEPEQRASLKRIFPHIMA